MRKRFLLEGDYLADSIWIAVEFEEVEVTVLLHLFEKSKVKREELENWEKGKVDLPASFEKIKRTISDANLLREDIKVENLGKVRDIEIEWADTLMVTRMFQGFDGEMTLLQERLAVLNDYSQEVFDECAAFWNRILAFKQDHSMVTQKHLDRYKSNLDILFEALKALRKDHKNELKGKAVEAKKDLLLKLEILNGKLDDKPNYKFTVERLKDLRKALNTSGLRSKDYRDIDAGINALFKKMSEARNQLVDSKIGKRVNDLEGIVAKMQKSVDWEKRTIAKEERNKDYASMAFQVKLLDAKIDMIKNRLVEKEVKLADVKKTLASLLKKQGQGA